MHVTPAETISLLLSSFLLIGGSTVIWIQKLRQVSIPRQPVGFITSWTLGTLFGLLALYYSNHWIVSLTSALLVFIGGLLLLTVALGKQRAAPGMIQVGDTIPNFNAITENREPFAINQLFGRPLLLKFFRGHW